MKGFKSVEEWSLNDCYDFLKTDNNKDSLLYPAIAERYDEMLHELGYQDDTEYAACTSIDNYEVYIKKYSDGNIVHYKAKHLDEAKSAIEDLFWNSHKKSVGGCKEYLAKYPGGKYASTAYSRIGSSKKTRWLVLGIALIVFVIAFFIGYKPVNSLSINESSLSFGKWGGQGNVMVSTNVSSNAVDVHCSGFGFSVDRDHGRDFWVSAEANEGDSRTGTVKVTAYATLYGMRIGGRKSASTILSQESGLANSISVSVPFVEANKWGGNYQFSVQTDGVKIEIETEQSDWIKIKKVRTYFYDITIEKNPADRRQGEIIVISGTYKTTIRVEQESGLASDIKIEPTDINGIAKEGTAPGKVYVVNVKTDGTSYSVTHPDWTDVTIYDDYFYITVASTYYVRDGSIVVYSNNEQSRTLRLYQDGYPTSFYADVSRWTFDTDSDYDNIYINNNSHQSVSVSINSTNKGWLSACMNGDFVRISCERNENEPRDGTVTLRCGDKETSIRVHQKGYVYENCKNCLGVFGYPTGKVLVNFYPYMIDCPICNGKCKIRKKSN